MFRQRRYPAGLLVSVAFLSAVACSDNRAPTALLAPSDRPATAQGPAARAKIQKLQLATNTLRIDGPAVSASIVIANNSPTAQTGFSVRMDVVQSGASRQAANLPLQCQPGDAPGFLPSGNCQMTVATTTSNAAPGSGTLVPGAGVLVMRLLQTVDGVQTELSVRSVDVNLVATPTVASLALSSTTLAIDGPSISWTATLQNPTKSLQGVALQGTIVQTLQGTTRRASGGTLVGCGSAFGVLPVGACTVTFSAMASNTGSGSGTLVPGAAVFELQMIQTDNGVTTVLDTRTVAVTLVSSTPAISSLVLTTTSLVIGTSTSYTVVIQNPGFPMSGVGMQGEMIQTTGNGTVVKGAGGTGVTCSPVFENLPTGTCTMQFTVIALGDSEGGAFVPGPASFVLRLYKSNGINVPPTELDVETVSVTLLSSSPAITSFTPASSYIVLDGGVSTSYTATIENPGAARSIVSIQNWITQGTARRAAAGSQVRCSGAAIGALPTGTCTTTGDIVAGNGPASGTGTLVPGPATLEVELRYYDGTTETILETGTYAITLVASTPSIVSLVFNTTSTIAIGGQARYTATLYNPTNATLTGALVQGYITQGANSGPAGGVLVSCPTNSQVAPGSCVVSFTANPSNAGTSPGPLVAGSATFVLEFRSGGTLLDTRSVSITLTP